MASDNILWVYVVVSLIGSSYTLTSSASSFIRLPTIRRNALLLGWAACFVSAFLFYFAQPTLNSFAALLLLATVLSLLSLCILLSLLLVHYVHHSPLPLQTLLSMQATSTTIGSDAQQQPIAFRTVKESRKDAEEDEECGDPTAPEHIVHDLVHHHHAGTADEANHQPFVATLSNSAASSASSLSVTSQGNTNNNNNINTNINTNSVTHHRNKHVELVAQYENTLHDLLYYMCLTLTSFMAFFLLIVSVLESHEAKEGITVMYLTMSYVLPSSSS